MIKLYSYWRSSAAFRARIALNLKKLPAFIVPVPLLDKNTNQKLNDLYQLNPSGTVPVMVDGQLILTQSMAILEYLEERYPQPSLLPQDLERRALVRSLCQDVISDIHPLNNLRTLRYLLKTVHVSDKQKNEWVCHWIDKGFTAIEAKLKNCHTGSAFLVDDHPGLFEVCLIPQVRNALAMNMDISGYQHIESLYHHAMALPEFIDASWENQPDYGVN